MAFHEINDLELPNFICSNSRVIVKFTADDCPICKELAPLFWELSAQDRYVGIKFLKMDAKENPIACQQVSAKGGTPFMATYRNGSLANCRLVANKSEMVTILDNLLQ